VNGDAAVLQVEGLTKSFGDKRVLRGLSADVGPGERLGLSGPNGSGKTTLLRCIAGTVAADSGSIRVAGFEGGSVEARASIGATIAHEKAFYLRLSGLHNLLFYASLRWSTRADAQADVDSLVRELELEGFLRERTDRYSSGMMQQLGLARALIARPKLVLMDEPTRSLDADAVGRLWAAMDRRPETSVVIASHRRSDLDRCGLHLDLT
jgi:ABC-type multidrug transport system ATPase subunit